MNNAATKPIIDNLTAPEIAKHFSTPKPQGSAHFDFAKSFIKFLIQLVWPLFIGFYRAYIDFRSSEYQYRLARRDFYVALGIAATVSYSWLWAFQTVGGDHSWVVHFTFWNIAFGLVFLNAGMNFYTGARFSKPDYRAWAAKYSPSKRGQIRRQLVRRLGGTAQLRAISKAGWNVDYFTCDARIHWSQFPDDTIQSSCLGTDSRNWIWLRFNDDRYEKHYVVFGDLNYGKKNFVRVLIKALLGDPNTGIVIADADETTGSSFAEYENLLNVSLNLGIDSSFIAIQAVWNELRRRTVERNMGIADRWERLVLVLDEHLSTGIYNFWRRALREVDATDKLKRISRLLKEIADAGKMHNIHIVAVLDNTAIDYKSWNVMRTRFEAFAMYWKGSIPSKGKNGEKTTETAITHQFPYMDMVSVSWPNGGESYIMMKTQYIPEKEFIQHIKSRAIYLSSSMKKFLQDIRFTKIEDEKAI